MKTHLKTLREIMSIIEQLDYELDTLSDSDSPVKQEKVEQIKRLLDIVINALIPENDRPHRLTGT